MQVAAACRGVRQGFPERRVGETWRCTVSLARCECVPMPKHGWQQLLEGAPWFEREGAYPVAAYSEFMPAPRLGRKPYRHAGREPLPFTDGDPRGWYVAEYEEALE